MRIPVAIIFGLMCSSALADDSVTMTSTSKNQSAVQPVHSDPASTGNFCNRFYPAGLHAEGMTTMTFKIEADGSVRSIKLLRRSKIPELNDAAITCAEHWPDPPMKISTGPVETRFVITFYWIPPKAAPAAVTAPPSQ
jgi:TonB family protein